MCGIAVPNNTAAHFTLPSTVQIHFSHLFFADVSVRCAIRLQSWRGKV